MDHKKEIQDELRELSPFLSEMKARQKKSHLPKEKLDRIQSAVESRIFKDSARKSQPARTLKLWVVITAAAAAITLILVFNSPEDVRFPKMEKLSETESLLIEEVGELELAEFVFEDQMLEEDDLEELLIEENHIEELIDL